MVSISPGVLASESDHLMEIQWGTYRARQFWLALWVKPRPEQLEFARQYLTPAQFKLFQELQPSEIVHAISMCQQLKFQGHDHPDLLAAALLHDIGKVKHPLRLWERVAVVLGGRFFPRLAARWGTGPLKGLRRPFVVAAKHPVWGAEIAKGVGASPLTMAMIWHHQDTNPGELEPKEGSFLAALQAVDNNQ